ncbi:MAG: hypothetical protein JWP80_3836 [Pseudomonas sp.]|nr:hypothetical protein [Pseudomonas sp.]
MTFIRFEKHDRFAANRSLRQLLQEILPTLPNGLPSRPPVGYTRRLSKVRLRVLPTMEINPILNSIKDLSERSETIRGYL